MISNVEQKTITYEIEKAREKLNDLGNKLGHLHPEVVRSSEKLDRLLLQFYRVVEFAGRP